MPLSSSIFEPMDVGWLGPTVVAPKESALWLGSSCIESSFVSVLSIGFFIDVILLVSSINGDNGAIESPTPPRRGRKKKSDTTPSKKSKLSRKTNAENGSLEAETEENTPNKGETIEKTKTPPKKSKLSSKTNAENGSLEAATEETAPEEAASEE